MSAELAVAFLHAVTNSQDGEGSSAQFDTTALRELREVKAWPGRCSAVLPVTPSVSNRYGTLHGGCIATLVDTVGSAALVSVSPKGGVSLNINVNYIGKMPAGGNVVVEAQVVKVGKTIATIEVKLTDQATGALVAQGTHVKFIAEQEPTMLQLIEAGVAEAAQQQQRQRLGGAAASQQRRQQQQGAGIRSKL